MKKLALLSFSLLFLVTGCNDSREIQDIDLTPIDTGVNEEVSTPEENIEEGFTLRREDGRKYYYDGEVTVSGKYREFSPVGFLGDLLCFHVDEATAHLIPRDETDQRAAWFCFEDQVTVKADFEINDETIFADETVECIEGEATVRISNYMADRLESEVHDNATLEEIVSKEPFKTTCEI